MTSFRMTFNIESYSCMSTRIVTTKCIFIIQKIHVDAQKYHILSSISLETVSPVIYVDDKWCKLSMGHTMQL